MTPTLTRQDVEAMAEQDAGGKIQLTVVLPELLALMQSRLTVAKRHYYLSEIAMNEETGEFVPVWRGVEVVK